MSKNQGFTLIELLIVVLIIAILAAIAVPNFLEFQTRAKVSRVMSDMRTLSIAIEAYTVDDGRHPVGSTEGVQIGLWPNSERGRAPFRYMTTPIAYISSVPLDPFANFGRNNSSGQPTDFEEYTYNGNWALAPLNSTAADWRGSLANGFRWYIYSPGPTKTPGQPFPQDMTAWPHAGQPPTRVYDPTNGTISVGFISRTNKGIYTGNN